MKEYYSSIARGAHGGLEKQVANPNFDRVTLLRPNQETVSSSQQILNKLTRHNIYEIQHIIFVYTTADW